MLQKAQDVRATVKQILCEWPFTAKLYSKIYTTSKMDNLCEIKVELFPN